MTLNFQIVTFMGFSRNISYGHIQKGQGHYNEIKSNTTFSTLGMLMLTS